MGAGGRAPTRRRRAGRACPRSHWTPPAGRSRAPARLAAASAPPLRRRQAARRPQRRVRRPRANAQVCKAISDRRSSRPPTAPRRIDPTRARRRGPARRRSPRPRSRGRRGRPRSCLRPRRSGSPARGRTGCSHARGRRVFAASTPPARCATSTNSASCATRAASGTCSPLSSPGHPRPSHVSYAAPSASSTCSGSPSCSPSILVIAACWLIMSATSRWPESANSSATRNRCDPAWPDPSRRIPADAARTLWNSWSYFPAFSAMSSPNHFACS